MIVDNVTSLTIEHLGFSTMTMNDSVLHLNKILHTPSVPSNILFVHHLYDDNNVRVEFSANLFSINKEHTKKNLA